jgi:WD40 repeat protein
VRLLAVSAQDDKVRFWDTATREEAGRLSEPVPTIAPGLAFSPDGTVLALSAHHKVTLARVATGATIATFTAAYPYTRAMAFGPGGRLLAVAGDGAAGTVQLWLVAG